MPRKPFASQSCSHSTLIRLRIHAFASSKALHDHESYYLARCVGCRVLYVPDQPLLNNIQYPKAPDNFNIPQMSSVREPQVPSQDVEVTQETNMFVRASHWVDDVSPTNPVAIDEELGNVSSIFSDSVYCEAENASHSGCDGSTATASDVTQVYIHLRNGSRILVSISASAAVAQLHAEAVRRAIALGMTCTTSSTVLRTTGQNAVAVFGEDGLAGVLSATDNDTFLLDSVFEFLDLVSHRSQELALLRLAHESRVACLCNEYSCARPSRHPNYNLATL
jgi:hypothetical protein